MDESNAQKDVRVVGLGDDVHYTSHGSANGDYPSVCRTAKVTEVGGWLTTMTENESPVDVTPRTRLLHQRFDPEAVSLMVSNPTGLFFNEPVVHDEGRGRGTWHLPHD